MNRKIWLLFIWVALFPGSGLSADLALLVIDGDSYIARKAVQDQSIDGSHALQHKLNAALQKAGAVVQQAKQAENVESEEQVEGYTMEKLESEDEETQMMSSGVEWLAGVVVLMILGLLVIGARRRKM